MIAAPSLWLIVAASLGMLAGFIFVMLWATQPDPVIPDDWRDIDRRINQKG